jgi:hypothetical protein
MERITSEKKGTSCFITVRSVDDIYLEDIIHIIHPETAAHYLADTALPNRNIPVWDLPQGYNAFVNQYNAFHYQHPWMAYSDALADIKAGKVVLLRKHNSYPCHWCADIIRKYRGWPSTPLYSRLHYIISQQLKRQVYSVRPAVPVQHAQSAKTINSKSAGRLLAAGGVYNGNIDGFKKTAEQLGGDAPAGYAQVMDNKGLFITAASVAAGLTMEGCVFLSWKSWNNSGPEAQYQAGHSILIKRAARLKT